ncbi:MAG: hypothetical protein ACRDDZ_06630 [Marinifilaceae bacterium]
MKYIILALLTFLLTDVYAFTSSKKFATTISAKGIKEFVVDNKYGNITIKQTRNADIIVEATMSVEAKTQAKADETVEFIAVETTTMADVVSTKTSYGKNMDLRQVFTSVSVFVNYTIQLPENIMLRVINSRGNVSMPLFKGNANMNLTGGSLNIGEQMQGELYLILEDIDASIKKADIITMTTATGSINIGEINTASLTTSMTNCTVSEADKLNLSVSGGNVQIKEVENLFGSASTAKITVNALTDNLNMQVKWGSLNVGGIHSDFEKINIDANFCKVGLTFMVDAGYNLELNYNKAVKLDLPPSVVLDNKPTDRKSRTKGTAFVGNKKRNGQVVLELTNGTLYIQ